MDTLLDIRADFDRAERLVSDLARNQLPFAMAMALNDTAEAVKDIEETELPLALDRPTPFTQKAFYVRRASKTRLTARVGSKRIQNEYLLRQAVGGSRSPKGSALVVPVRQRLNKYGNMPRRALARAKARGDVFVASRRGGNARHLPPGIYQRQRGRSGGLKLLVAFEPRAFYKPRFQFHARAMNRARSVFQPSFVRRMRAAIASARR